MWAMGRWRWVLSRYYSGYGHLPELTQDLPATTYTAHSLPAAVAVRGPTRDASTTALATELAEKKAFGLFSYSCQQPLSKKGA